MEDPMPDIMEAIAGLRRAFLLHDLVPPHAIHIRDSETVKAIKRYVPLANMVFPEPTPGGPQAIAQVFGTEIRWDKER